MPYLAKAIDIAKRYFSNIKIEVMPLKMEEYRELTHHGLNGVICFQETYNREHYQLYHPRGMKSRFEWRCDGFDRTGERVAHRCDDDGPPPALSAEALLAHQVQH